jgi:hypothetical protein
VGLRHKGQFAVGLASLGLALAACTTSAPTNAAATSAALDTASSTSTAPTTAPTTPSATSTSPGLDRGGNSLPDDAQVKSAAGAEAFVKYVVGQVNVGLKDADPSVLDGLYTENCKTCASWVSQIAALKASGRHLTGPSYLLRGATTSSLEGDMAGVLVTGDQLAADVVNANGARVDSVKGSTGTNFYFTTQFAAGWKVTLWQKQA